MEQFDILSVANCYDKAYGNSIIQYKLSNGIISFDFSSLDVKSALISPDLVFSEINERNKKHDKPLWSTLSSKMLGLILDSSFDMHFIEHDDENWTKEMADEIWKESLANGLNSVVTSGEDGCLITVYASAIGSVNWCNHPDLGVPCLEHKPSSQFQYRIDDNWLQSGQKVNILNEYFKGQVGTVQSYMWTTGEYIVTMENGHNIPFRPSELEKVEVKRPSLSSQIQSASARTSFSSSASDMKAKKVQHEF